MATSLRISPQPSLLSYRPRFSSKISSQRYDLRRRVKRATISNSRGAFSVFSSVRRSCIQNGKSSVEMEDRPSFDLNLAVLLAGFAFEAYTTPPENVGRREEDSAKCQTVFLSKPFLYEVYDGQLFIKLKKGTDFPALDIWGTSDPYVIFNLDGQTVKSGTKWGTKEPTWNENYCLNINLRSGKMLQVAAWDANLVAPHKRMGNAGINLLPLFDGKMHELEVSLEGMGGGGRITLEVYYKSFSEIDEEKPWWRIPLVSDFFMKNNLGSALNMAFGSESINASQFVQSAFGRLKSLNSTYFPKDGLSDRSSPAEEASEKGEAIERLSRAEELFHIKQDASSLTIEKNALDIKSDDRSNVFSVAETNGFWRTISESIDQAVLQKLGFSLPSFEDWDTLEVLNNIGLESQKNAEKEYVRTGLANSDGKDDESIKDGSTSTPEFNKTANDIRKTTWDVLGQTESILGALMLSNPLFSQQQENQLSMKETEKNGGSGRQEENNTCVSPSSEEQSTLDISDFDRKEDEIKALFSTAESAMEAWAMLATSLGRSSFIKSEFEKICFLDNISSDTQVSIWRDQTRKRLVIAFRGTEQSKWKDLTTDLMLVPSGLNPERMGGNFKEEVQVHSGFLGAYDSVRNRIIALVKLSIGFNEDADLKTLSQWHLYVTGHSLGGALATLLAYELSSSQMAKRGLISISMYNFGSPRVGNRCFAEIYNQRVRDSWRIVNHRDIIPTVPRLMGYCHVAQPVYLAAGYLESALGALDSLEDEYMGDVIGESTPDALVGDLIRGERELVEKILQTEINLFRSIRDGTALMQHMEDFYYVTLLERVRSNVVASKNPKSEEFEA